MKFVFLQPQISLVVHRESSALQWICQMPPSVAHQGEVTEININKLLLGKINNQVCLVQLIHLLSRWADLLHLHVSLKSKMFNCFCLPDLVPSLLHLHTFSVSDFQQGLILVFLKAIHTPLKCCFLFAIRLKHRIQGQLISFLLLVVFCSQKD